MNTSCKFDDPDPFIISSLAIAGAATALQLLQLKVALDANELTRSLAKTRNPDAQLDSFEDSLSNFRRAIERIERSVDRIADTPDLSFRKRKFRMSLGPLKIRSDSLSEYNSKISGLSSSLNALITSANAIVQLCPIESENIGAELLRSVSESPNALNGLIAEGASNEKIPEEVKLVLRACEQAVSTVRRRN